MKNFWILYWELILVFLKKNSRNLIFRIISSLITLCGLLFFTSVTKGEFFNLPVYLICMMVVPVILEYFYVIWRKIRETALYCTNMMDKFEISPKKMKKALFEFKLLDYEEICEGSKENFDNWYREMQIVNKIFDNN